MREVIVKISPDGSQVDVDAQGFSGSSCTDFMRKTLEMLGNVIKEEKKPEFFHAGGSGIRIGG